MFRPLLLGALLQIAAASLANAASPDAVSVTVASPDEAAIRAARMAYKELASKDIAVVSKYWQTDAYSVWASGEWTVGHDSIVRRNARTLRDGVFVSGVREPQRVEVSGEGRGDAAESGTSE